VTNWTAVIAADFALPADGTLPEFVDELLTDLCSPDPALRDDQAYPVLATWIEAGLLDQELAPLGERVVGMFSHPELQARTFAALILAGLIHRDSVAALVDQDIVLNWLDGFAAWWLTEADLRGWDDQLGWLHAIAHGSDVVRVASQSPQLREEQLIPLLHLVSARLVMDTDYVFAHQEDDRMALAIAAALIRPELSESAAVGWLDAIRSYFEASEPGPVPAPASNAMRTLRSLYVMTDRGVQLEFDGDEESIPPHRSEILLAIGELLHLAFPHQV
jgi:Protein of unknown function (DUF2785)